ncbi:ATP-dependent helicase HrpB [Aliidiomarina sedimenti]|uniref:ATP-dependent helicase HrpB n=1 Tax=Aliidiomarina sedimenti TaxID=1933879 RepID=A0ABY0BUK0_9GAMM|nr:ATP-dependent helicase HrpB [Aliidiomarina sedimenti]RUO27925.1 ATP-dependent helicase HrpB [Aliidiomarina sedimenti]
MQQAPLPVLSILPQLSTLLSEQAVVLQAPPGAGKSTALPLHLLQHHPQQRWLLVQPRRIAALSIATYLAAQLGEPVGQQIGYQIRQQGKHSKATRLLVVTEGILTRMLQQDPTLDAYHGVIFDEFHERNLQSDLGLALLLESRQLRPALNLLVMSATLPAQALADWLAEHETPAAVLQSDGRQYDISISYQAPSREQNYLDKTAQVIRQVVAQGAQGTLVFVPGQGEIRHLQNLLGDLNGASVVPLHGALNVQQQQAALAAEGQPRVILATNIAETSLTIEGIDTVIDTGRERQAVYRPKYQATELVTKRIARAAAVQRAGRAGRTGPGQCIRIYQPSDLQAMAEYRPADIEQQDLSDLVLQIAVWGSQVDDMAWFTAPNQGHLDSARQQLQRQGLLCGQQATAEGHAVAEFATDTANASLLFKVQNQADATRSTAVLLVANQEEQEASSLNLVDALETILQKPANYPRTHRRYAKWCRSLNTKPIQHIDAAVLAECVFAYQPLGLARRRPDSDLFQLASGAGVEWAEPRQATSFKEVDWLLVTDVSFHQARNNGVIRQCLPLTQTQLDGFLRGAGDKATETATELSWRGERGGLYLEQVTRFGALELERKALRESPSAQQWLNALLDQVRNQGLEYLNWNDASQQTLRRLQLFAGLQGDSNAYSGVELLATLEVWAAPYWNAIRSRQQLQAWVPAQALLNTLDYAAQQRLQTQLPTDWQAPSGRRHRISYQADGSALVSLKLQEVFGLSESPQLADGSIPLCFDLLSPAARPLARTTDLTAFWQGAYQQVRKEMRGRYPKHPWPENPAVATATHLTKKALHGS